MIKKSGSDSGVPTASVVQLTGDDIPQNVALYAYDEHGELQPTLEKVSKLGAAYTFTADDVSDETYNYYKNWRCDYIITFAQDIEAGTFGLYGKYGDYEIAFVYPNAIHAGDSINLVESAGLGRLTYEYIKDAVGTFTCGAFNLSTDNRKTKNMTVKLAIWQNGEQETTVKQMAAKAYGFGDLAKIIPPALPTATVEKIQNPTNVALYAYDENGELQPTLEKVNKLGATYTFTADDVSDDTWNYYKNWRCDYVVTFDEDIEAGTFGLYGKYGNFDIAFVYPKEIHADDSINLVESAGLGRLTYEYIKDTVGTFTCGAFNLSADNHQKNMTVKLVVWKDGEQETTVQQLAARNYGFGDLAQIVRPDAPTAIVTQVEPETGVPVYTKSAISTDPDSITKIGAVDSIENVYSFSINPEESEATAEYYKDWLCDFKVTFNKDIPADTFGLYGSYGSYNIAFVYPEEINILVNFNGNGGTAGTNSATYDNVTPITLPTATWSGHAFNGWYTAASGGNKVGNANATYVPTEPTTLYAQWTAYTVTYDANGGSVSPTSDSAGSNGTVTLATPTRTGYDFNGWYTAASGGTKVGIGGASYTPTADITLYAQWTQQKFTVTFSAGTEGAGSVSSKSITNVPYGTTVTVNNNTLTINGTTVTATANSGYTFKGWDISNGAPITSDKTIHASFSSSGGGGCIPSGTMISMADGTKKAVENLTMEDRVLVFNHETGKFEEAGIIFIEADGVADYNVINLEFSDGSITRLIYEHGYFDLDLMKYVYIREDNYTDFIGHRFAKMVSDGSGIVSVTLVNAWVTEEHTGCFEFPSVYHLNFIADDFLSMPGGITGMFNFFDYDENLKYDEVSMAADIETYGLLDYEFYADFMTYEEYASYPAPYLSVAFGKGMMTEEWLEYLVARYVTSNRN